MYSDKFIIKDKTFLFVSRFTVEHVDHNILMAANRSGFLRTKVCVFSETNGKVLFFRTKAIHNACGVKVEDLVEDQNGCVIGHIKQNCIFDKGANLEFVVISESTINIVTRAGIINKFKVCKDGLTVAEFSYRGNINTSEIVFFDFNECSLDRRLGLALALIIL